MKRTVLTSLTLLLFAATAFAQLGITATYNLNDDQTTQLVDNVGVPFDINNGYELQLHYWFRLKEQRVEFQPTVYYAIANGASFSDEATFSDIGFQFEVNIYPFDFLGDCDCPTFGKQGPHLEKGFFIQLFPGVANRTVDYGSATSNSSQTSFIYGGGIGLDIGISNLLTLTPIATFRTGASPYNDLDFTDVNGISIGEDDANLNTYQVGLQATFRFDHKRY